VQGNESVSQANTQYRSLAKRLDNSNRASQGKSPKCGQCGLSNHATQNCYHLGKTKCSVCKYFGHDAKDCRKRKKGDNNKGGNYQSKKFKAKNDKQETMNVAEENTSTTNVAEELITYARIEEVAQNELNEEFGYQYADLDLVEPVDYEEMQDKIRFYDWVGDSVTTSHMCNQHDAFVSYAPTKGTSVLSVGNIEISVLGRGTVELETVCDRSRYVLQLKNVLHIPNNQNSLISLGRWDDAGSSYTSKGGTLQLTMHKKLRTNASRKA
jgi:hypothetical protein